MRDEYQRELVKKLRNEKKSFTEIGRIMGLSRHIIGKLYRYKRVSHAKRSGRKPFLKSVHHLAIKRSLSHLIDQGKKVNSTVVKNECHLEMSTRTVRRYLSKIGMKYTNVRKEIFLTKIHKQKRVDIVKNWLTENHNWDITIFSDEKRFTLDGSDNWMSCVSKESSRH